MNGDLYYTPAKTPDQLHPLVLAWMGDAVYELFVRQYVIAQPNHRPNVMHKYSTRYVSAKAQAQSLSRLLPELTEDEKEYVRRGRNAKSGTVPKNTDIADYRQSTAFECLLGYLYYSGRMERLVELMRKSVETAEG